MNESKPNILTAGSGPAVVLLHSSMSSKVQWFQLLQATKEKYRVIAVDLYGYGDSPFPTDIENFSLSHEVELVEGLINDVIAPDEPFYLVGHSYGGAVALRFAYKDRNIGRIRKLAIFEPVAFHLLSVSDPLLPRIRRMGEMVSTLVNQGKLSTAAETFIDHWNGPGAYSRFPADIQESFCVGVKKLPLDFQALINEPLSLENFSHLSLPVCLMAGTRSPEDSQRVAEVLSKSLPDCPLRWIEGGHMAPIYRAAEVNSIIRSFIK